MKNMGWYMDCSIYNYFRFFNLENKCGGLRSVLLENILYDTENF